jgi:hypothetical protein
MEVTGTVIDILEEQSGKSSKGPWRKQDFILKTDDQYPKTVCITVWGDNIDQFDLAKNEKVTAHIDLQSREYNGRWYTDVKAWKIERGESSQMDEPPPSAQIGDSPPIDDYGDDLPF